MDDALAAKQGLLKKFLISPMFDGLKIYLPFIVLLILLELLVKPVSDYLRPFAETLMEAIGYRNEVAEIVIAWFLLIFFLAASGHVVKTRAGKYCYTQFDVWLCGKFPLYATGSQLLGKNRKAFKNAVIIHDFPIHGAYVFGFISDSMEGTPFLSVVLVTTPNPLTGLVWVFNQTKTEITILDEKHTTEVFKKMIACGHGVLPLFVESIEGEEEEERGDVP